nr:MAG TPA: hypothetical protein [Caudoviricetes sp.]
MLHNLVPHSISYCIEIVNRNFIEIPPEGKQKAGGSRRPLHLFRLCRKAIPAQSRVNSKASYSLSSA